MTTIYYGVDYDSATNTYAVSTDADTDDIQKVLDNASKNATVFFESGTHTITDSLLLDHGDITIKGAGSEDTTLLFDMPAGSDNAFDIAGSTDYSYSGYLESDAHKGDYTITLSNTDGLQAGDLLNIQQQNTDSFLREHDWDHVIDTEYQDKLPQHETLAEIESINGDKVTLKTPILHDMDQGITDVSKIDALRNVNVEGIKITYDLPEADWDNFNTTEPDYLRSIALNVTKTVGTELSDIAVVNAPSHHIEFRTNLSPHLDGYYSDGAHNKGPTGDGYGLQLAETHYGTFENMEIFNTRHAMVFNSWHAETGNSVHIIETNRDINYHGGADWGTHGSC
jgi:hypothetical protein